MVKRIFLAILVVIFLLVGSASFYFYYNLKVPVGKSDQDRFFEVERGQSTLEIANNLKEKEFIRSPLFFTLYTRWRRINLLPGLYYLRSNMNILEIIDRISKGNAQEYRITIPEGWTIKQIADYLEKRGIFKKEDFLAAAKYDSQKFSIFNLQFSNNQSFEGYLFPDTYRISAKAIPEDIIKKMLENFVKRTEGLKIDSDIITLASIIEKEAKSESDRKIIAGIYLKRLKLGMFLESCPTVFYALGVQKERLSIEDTRFESPYNTYLHKGLPPGPISNPGLESIKAVLEPRESEYFYFLSDKEGNIHYAKSAAEHLANKEKYGL